jgi:hypothetical protein
MERSAKGIFLATAKKRAIVRSVTASLFAPEALVTTIPHIPVTTSTTPHICIVAKLSRNLV